MLHQKRQETATWIAFTLLPLSGFATDIYLPSLPAIQSDLHVNSIQVQSTIGIFLISYGISQLFIGGILDSFGRFKPVLWGLFAFAIASLLIATTHNIYLIYPMRVIHGITTAMIVVAKKAYFVDVYKGEKLKNYLSLFTIIWSAGPILAPFAGGYLQSTFGWQSNFYFLAIYAFVIAVLEFFFSGETLNGPAEFEIKKIAGVYLIMIKTSTFTLGVFMLGFAYSLVIIFNITGPYIIEHQFGYTAAVSGDCSLILGAAWMSGGFIGKATSNRPLLEKASINAIIQLLIVKVMLISLDFSYNIYTLVIFAFLINMSAGYTYNNFFIYCLSKFPKNAGTAGGLTGGLAYIIVSTFTSGIVSLIPATDAQSLIHSYLILILLSGTVLFIIYFLNKILSPSL